MTGERKQSTGLGHLQVSNLTLMGSFGTNVRPCFAIMKQ